MLLVCCMCAFQIPFECAFPVGASDEMWIPNRVEIYGHVITSVQKRIAPCRSPLERRSAKAAIKKWQPYMYPLFALTMLIRRRRRRTPLKHGLKHVVATRAHVVVNLLI